MFEELVSVTQFPLVEVIWSPEIVTFDWPLRLMGPEFLSVVELLETVKLPELVAVPSEVATEILPEVAPLGTDVLICESDATVKAAAVPLNATLDVPVKPEPEIVTDVPAVPLVGLNELIFGAEVVFDTLKALELVAVN